MEIKTPQDNKIKNLKEYQKDILSRYPDASNIRPIKGGANGIPFVFDAGKKSYFIKYILPKRIKKNLIENELRNCKAINSDFVVRLLNYGQCKIADHTTNFLEFDYIDGKTLNKLAADSPIDNELLIDIALGIAKGIKDLWSLGIIHRDIKPANVMLMSDNSIKIVDLGISHCIVDDIKANKVNGPLYYSSPEHLQTLLGDSDISSPNLRISFTTDLWGLGLIMYWLGTGIYPFDSQNLNVSICEDNVQNPSDINQKLDVDLAKIILRLLNKNPNKRLSTERLIEELESIKSGRSRQIQAKPFMFYVHQGAHNICPINYLQEFSDETDIKPDGMILSARFLPKIDSIDELKKHNYAIIIDPETYLLTQSYLTKSEATKTIQKFPYYDNSIIPTPITPESAGDESVKNWWLPQIIDFQLENGADVVLTPYFCINNLKDWIQTNHRLIKQTVDYIKRNSIKIPVYATLCIDGELIANTKQRNYLLDYFFYLKDIDGFYLLVKDDRKDYKPLNDMNFLSGLIDVIEILGESNRVILGKGDANSVFLSKFNLSAFSSNHSSSLRRFNYDEDKDPKGKGGGTPHDKVFVPSLFNFLRVEEVQDIKRQGIDLDFCNCKFCTSSEGRYAPYKHYIRHMAGVSKELAKLDLDQRDKFILSTIDKVEKNYRKIAGVQLHSDSIGDFIGPWKSVF